MSEILTIPPITIARDVALVDGPDAHIVRVTRVTPDGEETVESRCPALITISNELGQPRYPTAARTIAARRMRPTILAPTDLGLTPVDLKPRVRLVRQFVPAVQGNCEFISGETAADLADRLLERLTQDGVLS